jgi:N-acetylglucosamine-6-phosphate deacetylase
MKTLDGRVLTPTGWMEGRLHFDTHVRHLEAMPQAPGAPVIVPGFIDLHVHGGGGADVMDGGDAIITLARAHARHGTTALLATTMTAPPEDIVAALAPVAAVMIQPVHDGATVLGVHLEGPFISPRRLGAQPDFVQAADLAQIAVWHAATPLRVLTLAPERQQDGALIRALVDWGIRVQLGHSDASYEVACAAFEAGAAGVTHLYNAMSALHHRAPGLVGAALAHAAYAELIPDLVHVHPGALRVALRAIPGAYGVTDATAAAGMPDGDYRLGRQTVRKCLGAVRLADGSLAGSALTMDQAFRNLLTLGLDAAEASRRLSTLPADYLGLTDRGRITAGAWADFVVFDGDWQVREVVLRGAVLG